MVTRNRIPRADEARRPKAPAAGGAPAGPPAAEPWAALRTAWGSFGKHLPEMRDDLSCYAAVQADRARLAVAHVGSRVATGILHVVAVGAVFATAASLVIVGMAGGVAAALDGNVWLANVITGVAVIVALFAVVALRERMLRRKRLHRLMRRYEPRHAARPGGEDQNGSRQETTDAHRS